MFAVLHASWVVLNNKGLVYASGFLVVSWRALCKQQREENLVRRTLWPGLREKGFLILKLHHVTISMHFNVNCICCPSSNSRFVVLKGLLLIQSNKKTFSDKIRKENRAQHLDFLAFLDSRPEITVCRRSNCEFLSSRRNTTVAKIVDTILVAQHFFQHIRCAYKLYFRLKNSPCSIHKVLFVWSQQILMGRIQIYSSRFIGQQYQQLDGKRVHRFVKIVARFSNFQPIMGKTISSWVECISWLWKCGRRHFPRNFASFWREALPEPSLNVERKTKLQLLLSTAPGTLVFRPAIKAIIFLLTATASN